MSAFKINSRIGFRYLILGIVSTCICIFIVREIFTVKRKVILLVLDGLPHWYLEQMRNQGDLPGITNLVNEGGILRSLEVPYPSYTAAGLASIWFGEKPTGTGIYGNLQPKIPVSNGNINEYVDGFSKEVALSRFWDSLSWIGAKTVIIAGSNFSQKSLFSEVIQYFTNRRIHIHSIPEFISRNVIAPYRVINTTELNISNLGYFTIRVGQTIFKFTPRHKKINECTYEIEDRKIGESSRRVLSSNDSTPTVYFVVEEQGKKGVVAFTILDTKNGCVNSSILQRLVPELKHNLNEKNFQLFVRSNPLTYDNLFKIYEDKIFGAPYFNGGNGEAEHKLNQFLSEDIQNFFSTTTFAAKNLDPNLIVNYSAIPDRAGHLLMGSLNQHSAKFVYEAVIKQFDKGIQKLNQELGDRYAIIIASDHGMKGTDKIFSPNMVLHRSQLISTNYKGSIDITKTKIVIPPWASNILVVNSTEWSNGIIPVTEKQEVLQQAIRILANYIDPETNQKVIKNIFTRQQLLDMKIEPPPYGDAFIEPNDGYGLTSKLSSASIISRQIPPGGTHTSLLPSEETRAFFAAGGNLSFINNNTPNLKGIWDIANFISQIENQ